MHFFYMRFHFELVDPWTTLDRKNRGIAWLPIQNQPI